MTWKYAQLNWIVLWPCTKDLLKRLCRALSIFGNWVAQGDMEREENLLSLAASFSCSWVIPLLFVWQFRFCGAIKKGGMLRIYIYIYILSGCLIRGCLKMQCCVFGRIGLGGIRVIYNIHIYVYIYIFTYIYPKIGKESIMDYKCLKFSKPSSAAPGDWTAGSRLLWSLGSSALRTWPGDKFGISGPRKQLHPHRFFQWIG